MIQHKEVNNKIMTYSDAGYYIIKVGHSGKFKVAYDTKPLRYEYKETHIKIEPEKE